MCVCVCVCVQNERHKNVAKGKLSPLRHEDLLGLKL